MCVQEQTPEDNLECDYSSDAIHLVLWDNVSHWTGRPYHIGYGDWLVSLRRPPA